MHLAMAPLGHFRAMERSPVTLPVTVSDGAILRQGRTVDLGLGGTCVELAVAYAAGAVVRVALDAPHRWDPIELGGRVVWCQVHAGGKVRVGVRFEHPTTASIRALLEVLSPDAYDAT
ncbi:MAG TPA: PilZ domain-containing protein, partial [Polyangiaceae bacterium]|nr:PilZ domain-containing protein [Polyangiaceae bacterium]